MGEGLLERPDWDLPKGIHAFVTTRRGGKSKGAWASFNLGLHVDDCKEDVLDNREQLLQALRREAACTEIRIQWLEQIHGSDVCRIADKTLIPPPKADALHTSGKGIACCIMTADCLPVLFCSEDGLEIAVAHAGWRGLQAGVLENTVAAFAASPGQIRAWLGPAIGPCHFEVGPQVREVFLSAAATEGKAAVAACFVPSKQKGKWMADLYALARLRLRNMGVNHIEGSTNCTVCHPEIWYSHRYSQPTGRFATLIVKV